MRYFIAVEIPDKVKEALALTVENFKKAGFNFNYVDKSNMHITLLFIGECGKKEALEKFKESSGKMANQKFKIRIDGAGNFETKGVPKIFFADIAEGREELCKINEIFTAGFENILRENSLISSFQPHITIARIKNIKQEKIAFFKKIVKEQKIKAEFEVEKIVMYESVLKNSGADYREIEKIELK